MQKKEETLCTFIEKGTRLQLVKIIKEMPSVTGYKWIKTIYEVRINRKIISKSISEYDERKAFAQNCQNIVLQLKYTDYVHNK